MRLLAMAIVGLALASPMAAQAPAAEARVRQTVQAFYAAFNSHARIVGSASQCTPPIKARTGLMIRNAMNDDPRQTAATTPNNCGSGADEMNPAA